VLSRRAGFFFCPETVFPGKKESSAFPWKPVARLTLVLALVRCFFFTISSQNKWNQQGS
jgi:hypothetical protein